MKFRLILASQSRFRAGLLAAAGVAVEVSPAHVDEGAVKAGALAQGLSAAATALLLARLKAERVGRRHPEALVIGADQILVCEGRWFDKSADMDEAAEQLRALRGRAHELVTAVLCVRGEDLLWHHVSRPRLVMRDFSEDFLAQYLAQEGAMLTSTVGGYRVEGPGVQLFDAIEGEHSAIVGLPLLPLLGFLRQFGALAR
ncbi:MAG: Maf family protein [Acetobacteraceae bacterium]|nr:Maf family protein [Acetobacteraceae bacterium]